MAKLWSGCPAGQPWPADWIWTQQVIGPRTKLQGDMGRLWTPWRMQYVGGKQASGCIFCDKLAEGRDARNLILYRGEQAFVLLNLYPYNSGHAMVAPYVHTADLGALPPAVSADLWGLTQRCVGALSAEYRPHGYNLGMNLGRTAGAGVPDHLHLHIVPRWDGDTNFMPVLAETKVMPETPNQTYARLRPYFEGADGGGSA